MLILGALFLASAAYRRFTGGNKPSRTKDEARAVNRSARAYTHGKSLLDTDGNVLTPWRKDTPNSSGSPESGGWLNLVIVVLIVYLATGDWTHETHSWVMTLLYWIPELLRDWAILALCYGAFTLGYQYLVIFGLRGPAAIALQIVAEGSFLLGCALYSVKRADWPVTQRLGWLLEAVVLLLKMHSYIVVNAQLRMEVEAGGPGTGAIVFHLEKLDAQALAEAAAAARTASAPEMLAEEISAPLPAAAPAIDAVTEPAAPVSQSSRRRRRRDSAADVAQPPVSAGPVDAGAELPQGSRAGSDAAHPVLTPEARWLQEREQRAAQLQHEISWADAEAVARTGAGSANLWTVPSVAFFPPSATAGAGSSGSSDQLTGAAASGAPIADSPTSTSAPRAAASTSTRERLAAHAQYAHRLLGKFVFGLNWEGELVQAQVVAWPANVGLRDFLLFSFAPVLCYEPSFPRTQRIRVGYLGEKAMICLGLLTAGTYLYTQHVLPIINNVACLSEIEATKRLMLPLLGMWLIFFGIVFECICNFCAELTRFGARHFYGAWWNASTFQEVMRLWNNPVHSWLARHVYLDAMRRWGAHPDTALTITFLVSIVLHEIVVWAALRRITIPYLGLFSLLQLPLASIQRVPIIKGTRLGNMIVWAGLILGIALITVLYAKEMSGPCEA